MRHFKPLLAAAALVLSTVPVYADVGDQLSKFLPDDGGAAEDQFGFSVAISGTTAIVGAWYDDDNGENSGSAYVFDISDSANPIQLFKLLPDDGATNDGFGISVAISGTIAIVGAHANDDNGVDSGSAYLFDVTTGQQLFKLLPDDGEEINLFGWSVDISGTTAIVGARLGDNDANYSTGSAYIFDTTTGQQLAKLLADDGAEPDNFGVSVGLSGTTAVVGADRVDDNGFNSGAAYSFDISDPTNPTQLAKLLPTDGAAGDNFGSSIAISGAIAIVGAYQNDDNGTTSGSAYLFDPSTGLQIAELLPGDDATAGAEFGVSVGISGTIAIVGSQLDDDNGTDSGSCYLFSILDPTRPAQIAKLLPNDGAADDLFGHSVAISGDIAIIGAILDDDHGHECGSAYLFDAAAPSPCVWDLDGDGAVGPADLAIVLGNWGPVPPNDPIADLNNDGIVGPADLAIILGNWGPCE